MSKHLDAINENLTEFYNEIPKDSMDDIKDICKSIQESQDKLDNYLNEYKKYNLDSKESSKIVINCYKDMKTSSLDLYKQVENFEDDLCCYRIYICSDEKRAIEKNADIATLTVPNVSQPSFEFYDVPDNLRSVYVAVTAVNNSNEESNPAFCSLSPGYAIRKPTVLKATSIK